MRQVVIGSFAAFAVFVKAEEVEVDAAGETVDNGETVEESHVVAIKGKEQFDELLEKHQYNLVKFFAPWCGHCKEMKAPYEDAAKALKEDGIENAVLSECDATLEENKELAEQYGIQGFPTLKWFNNQVRDAEGKIVPSDYNEGRSAAGFRKFVEAAMKPSLTVFTSQEELDKVLAERDLGLAVYIFTGDAEVETVAGKVADKLRASAGATFYLKSETKSFTIYRGQAEKKEYDGAYEEEALSKWAISERVPLFGQITQENNEIFNEKATKGIFWACFDPTTLKEDVQKYTPAFVEVAPKQEFAFVWIDTKEFEHHAKEELGCTKFPSIVLQRGDLMANPAEAKVEQFIRSYDESTLDAADIEEFFDDIASGKLAPNKVPDVPDELDALDDDDMEAGGEDGDLGDAEEDHAEL